MSGKPARKEQIREAALTLFEERGYYGTGMEDIAGLLGMRASSLYNHVRSKQDLLADIMLTTMQELLKLFEQVTEGHKPEVALRKAMEAHVSYHAKHRRDTRIGGRELPSLDQPARDEVHQLRRDYARAWEGLIQRGIDDGSMDVLNPRLAAYALLEMGNGVSLWFRPEGPLSVDEVAWHYGQLALRQVGARATPRQEFSDSRG